MVRSYRYSLRPTRAQAETLASWVGLTLELYNAALEERSAAWRKGKHVSLYDQMHSLAAVREARPEFASVPGRVQRGVLCRLDRAFAGFFRRCRSGDTPGYPRFRSRNRWGSLRIDDLGRRVPICAGGKRVKIPLLGKVKFRQHRPLEGTPMTMALTQDARCRWFVTFVCVDVPAKPLPATGRDVGVDLGLTTFAATSDGELFDNPRPMRAAQNEVARAQRVLSKRKRGSHRRRKAARILAVKHAHVAAVRREHHIAVARALVARYDTIFVEDLNVKGLARGMLAKSVRDAGWGLFLRWLACKAEEAGRVVIAVNPAGTSQTCSACGATVHKTLAERVHRCPCGYTEDRDVNAARNILAATRAARRGAPAVGGRQRPEKPLVRRASAAAA